MKILTRYKYLMPVLLIVVVMLMPACKKDKCPAGSGGDLTLKLYPSHHLKAIPGSTVRIKFGAQDFPGENGPYDISQTANPAYDNTGKRIDTTVTFSGLKCGDYYIYGTGIDSSLSSTNKTVKGGFPYSTTQDNGTIELVLPVTE